MPTFTRDAHILVRRMRAPWSTRPRPSVLAAFVSVLFAGTPARMDAQSSYATPYTVSLIAGTIQVTGSMDGIGGAATFNQPDGAALDSAGNLYITDSGGNVIRKVTPSGAVTTLAGTPNVSGSANGTGGAATFNQPASVAVDGSGNLYVADSRNNEIRMITPAGVVTTLAGNTFPGSADGTGSSASFNNPSGIAIDGSGNLYVADTYNSEIRKVTQAGVVTTLAGGLFSGGVNVDGTGSSAGFYNPQALTVDGSGNVFVADTGTHSIRRVTPGGVVTTVAGSAYLQGDADGKGTAASLDGPAGIALDSSGTLYVADSGNASLRKIAPDGTVTTLAGGKFGYFVAGNGSAAAIGSPHQLALGGDGTLYFADSYNDLIAKAVSPASTGAPQITQEPVSQSVGAGAAATLSVTATGASLTYQWYFGGNPIQGATSPSYSFTATSSNAGSYTCDVTNSAGTATTGPAILAVAGPLITTQPVSRLVGAGATATFTVTATGTPPVSYQWDHNGTAIAGATSATYTLTVTGQADAGSYTCDVTDANGTTPSMAAALTVVLYPAPYTFVTLAGALLGSADGNGSAAGFNAPTGAAIDAAGNVYIADTGNSTIRKVTLAGVVTTVAGLAGNSGSADGVGGAARFLAPNGVAVDGSGDLYVADTGNSTIRKITPSGSVTTLAGVAGIEGYADGAGSSARFKSPSGIACDTSGDVFVADSNNNTIRMITPAGVVTTIAGNPQANASYMDGSGSGAQFNFPTGLVLDGAGNIYVADRGNDVIRKVTPSGVVTSIAGTHDSTGSLDGTGTGGLFDYPWGLCIDGSGNLYVADTDNDLIRKVTPGGVVTTLVGSAGHPGSTNGTGTAALFSAPTGVVIDGSGNLYVVDQANGALRKITPSLAVSNLAGSALPPAGVDGTGVAATFDLPLGIALAPSGDLYVADSGDSSIRKVSPQGQVTTLAGESGSPGAADGSAAAARFEAPFGIAVDSSGNAYVVDTFSNTIRKITSAGAVSTLAGTAGTSGSADGTGPAAQFNKPSGIIVDGGGTLYVADTGNNTVRKITPSGAVTTLAGSASSSGDADGSGAAARFNEPFGLALDSGGTLYVSDINNNTIRKITSSGMVTTYLGTSGLAGSLDGAGTAATFNQPGGLCFDTKGNLIITDTGNNTIRVASPSGTVTTAAGTPGVTGNADGTGPFAAFNTPTGVAVDGTGRLCVTDSYNDLIRVGTPGVNLIISQEPESQAVAAGATAVFSCGASGATSYQWYLNGVPLADGPRGTSTVSGSQGPLLVISRASAVDAGTLTCTASGPAASSGSSAASLSVNESPGIAGHLINLSCRALAGTGANVLIPGFVVGGGSGSVPILIRASGPAIGMAPFDVPGTLADPKVTLNKSVNGANAVVAVDAGWDGNAEIAAAAAATGAFSWGTAATPDSALYQPLAPSPYSAVIAGAAGTAGDTGVVLAEVYDASPPAAFVAGVSPRLVNLSTRAQVGTGSSVLIAGFVIGGNTSVTLLIRASGPAIAAAPFNVAGTLADPRIELHQTVGGADTVLASNAGWGGNPEIATVASAMGAFSWGSGPTPDSALLLTLAPGAYSAIVSGAAGTAGDTGVSLVEVYEVY